jgi:hypothetical protein
MQTSQVFFIGCFLNKEQEYAASKFPSQNAANLVDIFRNLHFPAQKSLFMPHSRGNRTLDLNEEMVKALFVYLKPRAWEMLYPCVHRENGARPRGIPANQ